MAVADLLPGARPLSSITIGGSNPEIEEIRRIHNRMQTSKQGGDDFQNIV